MMQTIRLIDCAIEILEYGHLQAVRPDWEFLLSIKTGAFSLEAVLALSEDRLQRIHELEQASELPKETNLAKAEQALEAIRSELFG